MSMVMQDKVWTTRAGETLAVDQMEHGHRANLLRYLWRNIESVRFRLGWYWALQVAMHDGGDMAHDALEAEAAAVDEMPAEELFLSLPLVKRLRELTPAVKGIPA